MAREQTKNTINASVGYAVLRHGGDPPERAVALLGLDPFIGLRLERSFRRRIACRGGELMPRFARHDRHVRAVMAEGGFPVLPERRK